MKPPSPPPASSADTVAFSPLDNELPLRWMQRLGLVPRDRLGTVRRALFVMAVTWLPIAVWSAMQGHLLDVDNGESLLRHYGIHVRCLLAAPLFILAENTLNRVVGRMAKHFLESGLVVPARQAAFEQSLRDARRLRDSSVPWVFVLGVTVAWLLVDRPSAHQDAMSWAAAADGSLLFGGWWYAYVARTLFIVLLLGWIWRVLLIAYWFWRIGRLELSFVPSHPDGTGGIGFVEKLPSAFSLVSFALSAVIASRWAHEIAHHDAALQSFALPAAAFAIAWTVFVLLPLLALAPTLHAVRARALPAYGSLVGEQGRLVHRRWILREPVGDEPVLDAPEIGPVTDAAAIYEAVKSMRIVPIGKVAIARILLPMAIPMFVAAALRVPVGELLLKIFGALL